jgi:catechol 2,3-dioxygenase-like lactoylglutathione lyase family enzyme
VVKLKRIDNSDLLVRDLEKTVHFYHDILGLPFFLPYNREDGYASMDCGNLFLFIFETPTGEHAPKRSIVNTDSAPGLDSIAFDVDDLDEAVRDLDGKVEWAGEITRWDHPSGIWWRYRGIYDPEGNLVYVTEPHTGR